MHAMRDGQTRLTRIVAQGLGSRGDGPSLLGGCYVAATGRDAASQAFVKGVFDRLVDTQGEPLLTYISWTDEAVAEDSRFHRYATWGYIALPFFVAGLGALIFLLG
jgi:hypothetical protein